MMKRFVALRDSDEHSDAYDVMNALDMVGIQYEYYGHNDEWSVLEIKGIRPKSTHEKTYEGAVDYAGCDEE
jgi:hypothetical protein